ncbi:adenylyl-sulfate kinase [Actinopolyspora saharensis]|uniref:Adenylyl-sulfate kinase n=1 Tax=Actinopolyspora saharensis TaxID=995062 RepID=A0A1H0ZZH9_9ACTN|nr:adenylyl-sulfate kinase [Actinopolyspora saharensis]SDQ32793.1 adenylylsulfate kinase [Actinopolyspora saharensis]
MDFSGATLWLTGLPGAGKSTIAEAVGESLRGRGARVEILDGDRLRTNLSADLGFSADDRAEHVRRTGFVARLLAANGVTVLVPVIAPYSEVRSGVREQHEAHGCPYFEVHVATPATECMRRDPKGLYRRAASGELSGLTGYDAEYQEPSDPDLRLDTTTADIATARDTVLDMLERAVTSPAHLSFTESDQEVLDGDKRLYPL